MEEDFRNLDKVMAENAIAKADSILLDLGLSSDEIENAAGDFPFKRTSLS